MGDVVLRVVAEKGTSVDQVFNDVQTGFRSMADSARTAVASMSLAEAKSAIADLTNSVSAWGHSFVDAAKEVSSLKRELSTVSEGSELRGLVTQVRELALTSGYSGKEIADMVRQMRNLGTVSEESLKAVMDMAAGTGLGLQTVGRNYQLIAEGGQGAERALLQLAKAGGITVEQMRRAGAEVSNGKLLTDTPEQAEKARLALEKLASSKWAGAAGKMQSAGERLSKELAELKADIGEQALAWEGFGNSIKAQAVHVLNESLTPATKATIGVVSELGGSFIAGVGHVAQFTASIGQTYMAVMTLVGAKAASAEASAANAVAQTTETVAAEATTVALTEEAVATEGLAAANVTAGASLTALAGPLVAVAALAAAAAVAIGLMDGANADAEQKLTEANQAQIHALSQHVDMVGKTAADYRAMGKTAADATQVVLGLQAKLDEAKKNGASQSELDKIMDQIRQATKARGELAATEGQVRQATLDTKAALESAEHAYKLNETSLQALITAHRAHIETLRHEIEQVGENSVKGQELLKQQRSEEEAVYQLERQRTDDLFGREKERFQLGKTGYEQLVTAAREHVHQLEAEHAKDADVMKAKIELVNLVKHRLEEEMHLRGQLANFEMQQARNSADFARRFAREGQEDTFRRRVADAQQAVETAKQVQAAHRAVGIEDVNDSLRVRNAQINAAQEVHEQKLKQIRDEVENVQEAERTKVELARQTFLRERADYDKLAKTPGANGDDLRKASQKVEQARQGWVTAYTNGEQAIKESNRKADQEIYENDAQLAAKRQALDADYEATRLASIERIRSAELKQTEDVANERASFLKKAMDALVQDAGSAGPDTTKLQKLSKEYIAEKQKAQEAAYARDEKSAEDNAEKLFGLEKGREQEKQQYLETQRKLLRARLLSEEIDTIQQVMNLYKNASDKGPLQGLQRQLEDLQRQLAELEGFDRSIQQAAQSANDGKSAVESYASSVRQSSSDADKAASSNSNLASSYERVAGAANAASAAQSSLFGHKLANYSPSASYGVSQEKPQGNSPGAFGYDPNLTKPEDTRKWDRSDWESARNAGYNGAPQTPASAPAAAPYGYDHARDGGFDWQTAGRSKQETGPSRQTPYGGEGALPAGYTTSPTRLFMPPERLPDPTGFWTPRHDTPDDSAGSQTVVHATNFISMGGGLAPAPVRDAVTALNEALARTMASPNRWGDLGVT